MAEEDPRLAICAAMRWELRPILRALPGVRLLRATRPRTWLAHRPGGPILVFQTGIGIDAAAAATQRIVEEFSIGAIINTGCAGALSPTLVPGAVVLGSTLLVENGQRTRRYDTSARLTSTLARAAEAAGLQPSLEPILTSAVPLADRDAKAAAFIRCAAVAVEMEGAAIAQVAGQAALEMASVRVILDDAVTALPIQRARKTMFDFARNATRSIVSAEQVKRFSIIAKNAVVVDRVLGNLFESFLRSDV